jgi:predicted small lipoprotein YifL
VTSTANRIGSRNRLLLASTLFASLLGCGYKGPLYLPPPPDTLSGQGTVLEEPETRIPPESINPSLEPAPIVIE